MIFIVILTFIVLVHFYIKYVKKEKKTFKICIFILIFTTVLQGLYALEYDLGFPTDEIIIFLEEVLD